MKIRPRVFLLWFLLLMAAAPAILAQDNETFGLSQADFSLLAEANTATAAVRSVQFDFTADLALSGASNTGGTLNLEGSGALIPGANPALDLTVSGQTDLGGAPAPLDGQFRLVDGIFYFNLADPNTGEMTGWLGQPLEEIANGLSQATGIPLDPAALSAFDTGALVNMAQPQQFVAMRREDDAQDTAHFVMDLNFNALFDSPFVGGILAQAAAFDPTTPTAGQLAAVFENSTLRVEQWIGLEDGFVHRTLVDLALNINPQALNLQGNRGTIALTFDVTLDAFNETVSITAPEDAFVLSAETPTTTDTPASPVAAQPITANTPTIVELTGQGAVDLTYMAPGAETINVTARSVVANTVDPTVEVIGPDGQTLAFNDDHSPSVTDGNLGAFDSAIQDLALPGAGAYTIRVGSYNNSGLGEVEVLVESAASSVAPPALAESEIVPGSLASGGTFAYSFTANAGETITLAARDLSNTLDPSLLLMDSQFNRVAENDDHASDDPALDQHDPKIQDFVIPADGVYNVLVSDDAGGEGAFQLVIIRGGGRVSDFAELEPASVAAIEPPADDPDAMRLGEAITLNLDGESAAARNFYGAAGQEITITARAVNPPDMDIYLTVFAPNGAQIAFNDDHWSGDTSLGQRDARIQTLTLPSDGAYRIEVDSWFDLSGEVAVEVEEG